MRERREVAGGADAAAARHDGHDAAVEAREQELDRLDARARCSLRERVRAQEHRGAHDLVRIRLADAARVRAQEPQLQLLGQLLGNRLRDEAAEAGVDAVRVLARAVRGALDELARGAHLPRAESARAAGARSTATAQTSATVRSSPVRATGGTWGIYFARARELVLDLGDVDAARGEQHVQVEDEVGRLRDERVPVAARRRRRSSRPPPRRPSARSARTPASRSDDDVRALRPLAPRARRSSARAPARSTSASRCGTRARPDARAASSASPSQSSRISSTASTLPDVSPLRQSSLARAAPEPRLARLARQPLRLGVHPREHEHAPVGRVLDDRGAKLRLHRGAGRRGRAARRAARRAAPGPRGGSTRAARPATPRARRRRARALPAPPDAITGQRHRVAQRCELLEVVALLRAVAVDRGDEQLAGAALLALARPLDACRARRRASRRASARARPRCRSRRRPPGCRACARAPR